MVACVGYLETQSHLLRRGDFTSSNSRYVCIFVVTGHSIYPIPVLGIVGALQLNAGLLQNLALLSGGNGMSDVAVVLSIVTNVVATSLIALKAL